MTTELPVPQKFIDGVTKLHTQLRDVFSEATKHANKLLGTPLPQSGSTRGFSIFVDFGKQRHTDRITGYFMSKNTILRFLPIEFDTAMLFPVRNHGGGEFYQGKGISIAKLNELICDKRKVRIIFRVISAIENLTYYDISIFPRLQLPTKNEEYFLDEIGCPINGFNDIEKISVVDTPPEILDRTYTLADKKHFAPFTKETEIHCVLYAQLEEEPNPNRIQVLRWFPTKKGIELDQLMGIEPAGGDVFFELGYVGTPENEILHSYMIENDARLLFGTIKKDSITIAGGVKIFQTNNFKYPRCLYNIKLQ